MPIDLAALRAHTIARAFAPTPGMLAAIESLGFVQIDPIRAPARAADLILRQRVLSYRAGDLDRAYPDLPLAEDYLHVYGVMPVSTLALLHPRGQPYRWRVESEHPRLARRVLAHVERHGETHPRDLATALGRTRTASGWGGESTATTRMLEVLHYRGKLRVARRVQGIKVYALAASPAKTGTLTPMRRATRMLELLLAQHAPVPEATFRQLARMITESSLAPELRVRALAALLRSPEVRSVEVDGVTWLLPAAEDWQCEPEERVRLLAPFDPVVWCRRRFALLWGWEYRLEAYTPPAKRQFGYYALPLLWRDQVIGWANVAKQDSALQVELGFVGARPRAVAFRRELEAEVERLRTFLVPRAAPVTK